MANSSIYNTLFSNKSRSKKGGSKMTDFANLLQEKKMFLISVFANLIAQLAITYYVMVNYSKKPSSFVLLFIGQIALLFIMALVPMPSWLKFLLFCLFSSLSGIMLSSVNLDKKVIHNALFGTMSIFTFMFLAGLTLIFFGVYLSSTFGFILFLSLLTLIIAQLVFSFTQSGFQRFFYFAGLLLFSIYIIYDTNVILRRDYYGDFITASMDYYLDILNIFLNLVGIGSDN